MKDYFMDLHIHVGRSENGKAVKITASPKLTVANILSEALNKKGLQVIGIVDCASPGVLTDLKTMLAAGTLQEMAGGGFSYLDNLALIPGVELETQEGNGQAHFLAYFPTMARLEEFARFVAGRVKNPQLSTQACHLKARDLLRVVLDHAGLFVPAHIFTPHRSIFGACATSLEEMFPGKAQEITAVELGLSADSQIAGYLPELRHRVFLSNSDAHSLEKIGREYNLIQIADPSFTELKFLLENKKGRRVIANYGLDPRLGKYHRSYCNRCNEARLAEGPVLSCPECGEKRDFVTGVWDRIYSISPGGEVPAPAIPYKYQVPLAFLPGMGKKTQSKLLERLGTEMNVIHQASTEELSEIVGKSLARMIVKARQGELTLRPGAGGIYGKVDNTEYLD